MPSTEAFDWGDSETAAVIARGYADGTIDPAVPAASCQQAPWALIYAGWEYARYGAPKHEALALTLESVRRIAAPAAPGGPVVPPVISGPVVPPA